MQKSKKQKHSDGKDLRFDDDFDVLTTKKNDDIKSDTEKQRDEKRTWILSFFHFGLCF